MTREQIRSAAFACGVPVTEQVLEFADLIASAAKRELYDFVYEREVRCWWQGYQEGRAQQEAMEAREHG